MFPLADDCVDVVTAFDSLEHLLPDDVDAVLNEIARILKPGGTFIASICYHPQQDQGGRRGPPSDSAAGEVVDDEARPIRRSAAAKGGICAPANDAAIAENLCLAENRMTRRCQRGDRVQLTQRDAQIQMRWRTYS